MNTLRTNLCFALLACIVATGCDDVNSDKDGRSPQPGMPANDGGSDTKQPGAGDAGDGQGKAGSVPPMGLGHGMKTKLGENVFLETLPSKQRVVRVEATVCLREGMLEHLLCRKMTKEHEAILTADVDAFIMHAALLAAGAEAGKPVQFDPVYKPATGTTIKVWLQYKDKNGKEVIDAAQKWIRHGQTKKDLHYDWVFAGSRLEPDPDPAKKPYYVANGGDVICVSNFSTSLLDIPVATEKDINLIDFEAATERIPALGTPVTVYLEPVLKK